ncbi:MAG: transposase, partial [Serratia symbiotica]|nr:transposase [Serratia symbiotica]
PDRQGKHPPPHLRQYSGVLQADAYGAYNRWCTDRGCMLGARP